MSAIHEINKIHFQIDGKVTFEIRKTIEDVVPEIIETYFNQFDRSDRLIPIKRFHFDLGKIKASNFKDELIVRLSYLLQTELKDLFESTDFTDEVEKTIKLSYGEAIIKYLKEGWSQYDSYDLNDLFVHLLKEDFELLRAILSDGSRIKEISIRLFYQLDYRYLKEFWIRSMPLQFQQVESVYNKIFEDTQLKPSFDSQEESLARLLKRLMIDFLLGYDQQSISTVDFVDWLKSQADEFKPFEHSLPTTVFKYLDSLTTDEDDFRDRSSEPDHIEILLDFILRGNSPETAYRDDVWNTVQGLKGRALEAFAGKLIEKFDHRSEEWSRLKMIFSSDQIEEMMAFYELSSTGYRSKRLSEIRYIKAVFDQLFSEDLPYPSPQFLSSYLSTTTSRPNELMRLVEDYVKTISAKRSEKELDLVGKLITHSHQTSHEHTPTFKRALQKLKSKLEGLDRTEHKPPADAMNAYLHFLTTGIWLLEDTDPDQTLSTLLKDASERLVLELKQGFKLPSMWLRLIYQHPLVLVKTLFVRVFEGDDDLDMLHDKLENFDSTDVNDASQRKLLESFFLAKALFQKDLGIDFLMAYDQQSTSSVDFVDWLKSLADEFKPFEHLLPTNVFKYLDNLIIDKGDFRDRSSGADHIEALLNFILIGNSPETAYRDDVWKTVQELKGRALEAFAEKLIEKFDNISEEWNRLKMIFSSDQIEEMMAFYELSSTGYRSKRLSEIRYIKAVFDQLFSEDLPYPSPQFLSSYLSTTTSRPNELMRLVEDYVKTISAKRSEKELDLVGKLITHSHQTSHEHTPTFKRALQKLKSKLEGLDRTEHKPPADAMNAYLHFLTTGIWLLEDTDPDQTLSTLLKDASERLVLELKQRFNLPTVWLRLIYQHPVDLVKTLFVRVFEGDDDPELLHDKLESFGSRDVNDVSQRKLLEYFFLAKALYHKDLGIDFRSFFEKKIEELISTERAREDKADELDINQVLNHYLKGSYGKVKPTGDTLSFMIKELSHNPHHLLEFLLNNQIEKRSWRQFLSHFDRGDLSQVAKIITTYSRDKFRWFDHLISGFSADELKGLFKKSQLIALIVHYLFDEEAKLETIFTKASKDFKKGRFQDDESIESILESLTDETALVPHELRKEYSVLLEEIKSYQIEFKKLGVEMPYSYWSTRWLENIPFSQSTEELRKRVTASFCDDFAGYAKEIKLTTGIPLEEKIEGFDITNFVVALIDSNRTEVQPYFQSFEDFEIHIVDLLTKSRRLNLAFTLADPRKLIIWLENFSPSSISLLEKAVLLRFGKSSFGQLYGQVLSTNLSAEKAIKLGSIAYGISHSKFDARTYIEFLHESVAIIRIEDSVLFDQHLIQDEGPSKAYLKAFIHYLGFRRYNYLPLERDGLLTGFTKIMTYRKEEFMGLLRISFPLRVVVESLFEIIPQHSHRNIFSQFFPHLRTRLDHVLATVTSQLQVEESLVLSTWMRMALINTQSSGTDQVIRQLVKSIEHDGFSQPTAEKRSVKTSDSFPEEPPSKVTWQEVESRYSFFELLAETIKSGKLPTTESLSSSTDFTHVLKLAIESEPEKVRVVFRQMSAEVQGTRYLFNILGRASFWELMQKVETKAFRTIQKQAEKLSQLHAQLGDQDALIDYFSLRYLSLYYKTGTDAAHVIAPLILDAVPQDFELSATDYQVLLSKSRIRIIKEYVSTRQKEYSESIVNEDVSYSIDTLLYMTESGHTPWWSSEVGVESGKPLTDRIKELLASLVDESPADFIKSISKRRDAEQVVMKMATLISGQQLDKLLASVAPNIAGFIISFDLLLIRSTIKIDREKWLTFLIMATVTEDELKASTWMPKALSMASKLSSLSITVLRQRLLETAKVAIKNREMRFLPFIDLLGANLDESSIKAKETPIAVLSTPMSLQSAIIYYLRVGSLPSGFEHINSRYKLLELIQNEIEFRSNEFRLSIQQVLASEVTRNRLIKSESDHFLRLMIQILYPGISQKLLLAKEIIIPILVRKWEGISEERLNEAYYQSMFVQVTGLPSIPVGVSELTVSYVLNAAETFKQTPEFEYEELADSGLDKDIISSLLRKKGPEPPKDLPPLVRSETGYFDTEKDPMVDQRVLIKNAGLVITWPFLTRYFDLLEMTEEDGFKTVEDAIRAVHLLQYIATGSAEAPEHELLLNKVLCGLKISTPVPVAIELSNKEIETTHSMLTGLLQNWDKVKSSSIEAVQEGFMIRDGYILEKEDTWELKVEKKTLDILMENLPWALGMVKLPWMEKRINVEWL